jgi:osmotically-inducible protein OsmY
MAQQFRNERSRWQEDQREREYRQRGGERDQSQPSSQRWRQGAQDEDEGRHGGGWSSGGRGGEDRGYQEDYGEQWSDRDAELTEERSRAGREYRSGSERGRSQGGYSGEGDFGQGSFSQGNQRRGGYARGGYGQGQGGFGRGDYGGYGQGGYGQSEQGQGGYGQGEQGQGAHGRGSYVGYGRGGSGQESDYGRPYYGGERGYGYFYGGAGAASGGYSEVERPRPVSRGPKGYKRSDERLKEDISERIMQRHDIDASEVTVEVQNGKVTLEGTVSDRRMKHALEDLADACPGVEDVDNRVRVSRGSGESESGASGSGSTSATGSSSTGSTFRTTSGRKKE